MTWRWPFKKPENPTVFRLHPFQTATGTVAIGLREDGAPAVLNFTNVSGVVVGGMPGSGKTAGMELLVMCFLLAGCHVHVVDGKGGGDWSWIQSSASSFVRDDLDEVRDMLVGLDVQCRERLASMASEYGNSNYWNLAPENRPPMEVVVIDECQTFFDTTGMNKDDKVKAAAITKAATNIVRKGRSAGFCLLTCTQKPTTDSLPSSLRDNCGIRICFRVSTLEAAKAVLGSIPDGSPSPLMIPQSRNGGAVIGLETGELVMCRFAFISESQLIANGQDVL